MAAGSTALLGGTILAGAIAGSQGSKSQQTSTSSVNLRPAGEQETRGAELTNEQLTQLQQLLGQGPGMRDVTQSLESSRSLADQFRQASETGGLPTSEQFSRAQGIAQQVFQPQQVALEQSQQGQIERANQLAAQLGRPINDPVIQSELSRELMMGQERLRAQQGSFAQNLALQLPSQQLSLASQAANIEGNLASQALQNRQTLLGLGNMLQQQGRQFRLGAAGRTSTTTQTSGGGLQGALTGAIGGAGAGAQILGSVGGFGAPAGGTGSVGTFGQPSGGFQLNAQPSPSFFSQGVMGAGR